MTITGTPATPDAAPPPRPSRWGLATAIAAAVAVVAIGMAAFAVTRDDASDSTTIATRDVAATQQIGQGASNGSTPAPRPPPTPAPRDGAAI